MTTRRKKIKKGKAEPASSGFRLGNNAALILAGVFLVGIVAYALLGQRTGDGAGVRGSLSAKNVKHVSLPSYAYKNEKTIDAYTKATEIPHILEWIPCYCGCGGHAQHKNNMNCFLRDDGSFDPHGADCEMCMDIAISVHDWYTNGVSLQEIRNRIERAYGGRYADPTPTPPIPEDLRDFTIYKDPKFAESQS